ncbi:MAG: DNA-formamidopyrimidine glycosylase family protein [Microthrixaceae bacterium]
MPELIEAQLYADAAGAAVGATIGRVELLDATWVRGGLRGDDLVDALVGRKITGVGRHGKVVLLHTDGPTLALRFGMTGRLLWDERSPVDSLVYGPGRSDEAWVRFALWMDGDEALPGGRLAVEDARRLGSVELNPDLASLGPDARGLAVEQLRKLLAGGRGALKSRLMDQRRLAGLGNLLTDEILWRAGLHPARPSGGLDRGQVELLAATMAQVLDQLTARGGSHLGDLQPAREEGGRCPIDGALLRRTTVGGRTSYWCPLHQSPGSNPASPDRA